MRGFAGYAVMANPGDFSCGSPGDDNYQHCTESHAEEGEHGPYFGVAGSFSF